MNNNKVSKAFGIISIIFTVIATVLFIVLVSVFIEFINEKFFTVVEEGENLQGLGLAVLLIFYLVFWIGLGVISIITIIFSILARKWNKIVWRICLFSNIAYIVLSSVGFASYYLM